MIRSSEDSVFFSEMGFQSHRELCGSLEFSKVPDSVGAKWNAEFQKFLLILHSSETDFFSFHKSSTSLVVLYLDDTPGNADIGHAAPPPLCTGTQHPYVPSRIRFLRQRVSQWLLQYPGGLAGALLRESL